MSNSPHDDYDNEEVLDIDDPRVPEVLRAHAQRFRQPGRIVVALGGGQYVLGDAHGELLDLVHIPSEPGLALPAAGQAGLLDDSIKALIGFVLSVLLGALFSPWLWLLSLMFVLVMISETFKPR